MQIRTTTIIATGPPAADAVNRLLTAVAMARTISLAAFDAAFAVVTAAAFAARLAWAVRWAVTAALCVACLALIAETWAVLMVALDVCSAVLIRFCVNRLGPLCGLPSLRPIEREARFRERSLSRIVLTASC